MEGIGWPEREMFSTSERSSLDFSWFVDTGTNSYASTGCHNWIIQLCLSKISVSVDYNACSME